MNKKKPLTSSVGNAVSLDFRSHGNGEPIMILHGLLGSKDNWNTLAKKWAGLGYKVVLPDLRDHGRSPHTDQITYQLMAADTIRLIEDLQLGAVTLVGHSMGGKVAMQLALDMPDLVRDLIIIDISPKEYLLGHEVIFNALLGLDLSNLHSRTDAADHLKKYIEDEGVVLFLLKNLSRKKAGGFVWKVNLPVIIDNYNSILTSIESKYPYNSRSLFIRGSKSPYIADEDFSIIRNLFPLAEIVTIMEAGHWVHAEKPQELFGVINDFLK